MINQIIDSPHRPIENALISLPAVRLINHHPSVSSSPRHHHFSPAVSNDIAVAYVQIWAFASYALAVVLIIALIDAVRTYRRLSHIPGPKSAAFSRLWILLGLISGRFHAILGEANQTNGPLVRIGPNHLFVGDPEVWRRTCGARSPYRRGDWYNTMQFKPRSDNALSTRFEECYDELKRKMAAKYSGKENHGLEQCIDARVPDFINLVDRKYISTDKELKWMDFGQIAQFFTLDVISDLAFGKPFGDVADDEDKFEYIKTGEENVLVLMFLTAGNIFRKQKGIRKLADVSLAVGHGNFSAFRAAGLKLLP
jgi:hypothetical protein